MRLKYRVVLDIKWDRIEKLSCCSWDVQPVGCEDLCSGMMHDLRSIPRKSSESATPGLEALCFRAVSPSRVVKGCSKSFARGLL